MDQAETVGFLSSGAAFPSGGPVEVIETHGAYVFLSGDTALKLKRAVRYDYMDLSTVELRHEMTRRELELNKPAAPGIYRDILPVTRGPDGLELGGPGPVVDWVLRMWRFPAENELESIVAAGGFDDALALRTGRAIAAYHADAPIRRQPGGPLMQAILDELGRVFGELEGAAGTARVAEWRAAAAAALEKVADLLDVRGEAGHVRRAHGDLHLRNLVIVEGRPVPFDALEFDETLGTCDILYDIAFLVMDLCHRDLARQACRVLDAWLSEARGAEDAGLAALPLFLSVRAAIRAMVQVQTDAARGKPGASAREVAAYLDLACDALRPAPPILVAVGGCSGSGKSVLARALAPGLGPLPGAVLLSSDLERKVGRNTQERLDPASYSPARRAAVYDAMFDRVSALLAAGQAAILDATFLDQRLRARVEDIAMRAGVPFLGLWLEAAEETLAVRLRARRGDASDADVEVLRQQIATGPGALGWHRIDASAPQEEVQQVVLRLLD